MTTAAQRSEQIATAKNQVSEAISSLSGSDLLPEHSSLSPESEVSENTELSTPSFSETLAQENEQKHQYSQLDKHLEGTMRDDQHGSENSLEQGETVAKSSEQHAKTKDEQKLTLMCDDDAAFYAGHGVSLFNKALPVVFKAPIGLGEEEQEAIAVKAMPLIKKYFPEGKMPQWAIAYEAELKFGVALGGALLGCYQQAKAYKLPKAKSAKVAKAPSNEASESESTSSQAINDSDTTLHYSELSYGHGEAA